MLIVVSPAKKLDFDSAPPVEDHTQPDFLDTTKKIIKDLKKLEASDLMKMMKISQALGDLNYDRNQSFKTPFTLKNAKQAAFAFKGDTYQGLEFETFTKTQMNYAQKHFRILSGLYGLLKPLDLIQPYRLEMGTSFGIGESKNLYGVWSSQITNQLKSELKKEKTLVNLASKEYFSAIDFKDLGADVITPVFKEFKNGKYKIISFNAKRARGMMSQYILKNKIDTVKDLQKFDMDNYKFNKEMSNNNELVFTRS
jgi:hypothetical protein